MRIQLGSSGIYRVYIPPSPVTEDTVPFHFRNHTNQLIHLAVFDYEQCSLNDEAAEDLFSIDESTDNMQVAQVNLPKTAENLYLVKAYFLNEDAEMIIQKTDQAETLNLEITLQNQQPAFTNNGTYRILNFTEAERILNRMQI